MSPKIIIPIVFVIAIGVTIGAMYLMEDESPVIVREIPTTRTAYVDDVLTKYFEGTHDIKKISSEEELKEILEASALLGRYSYDFIESLNAFRPGTVVFDEPSADMFGSGELRFTSVSTQSSSVDYSTTNIQVANVDELDYLKNDSKYVYIVSQEKLSIIDAYPAESAELILKAVLDIESLYNENMFLNKDRLVIFYQGKISNETIPQYGFIPRSSYSPVTHALIIDISDKKDPVIIKDYTIDGNFRDARMIGNYVYFVTSTSIDYGYPRLPIILEDSERTITPDAFYFDSVEQLTNFNTLTAIDIFGDTINSETYLMGHTGTFYVSEDNFYLTYQQNMPFGFYKDTSQDRFFEVIVPLLPSDIQGKIQEIQSDSSLNPSAQWIMISELMQDSYNAMHKKNKEALFDRIGDALYEYDTNNQEGSTKTVIHKISIDQNKINHVAKGMVPGRLLNQFSMDQSDDRFRIATTTDYHIPHKGTIRSNGVYVLDQQLDIVGALEQIAPDESIYSSRFIGDRLYLVTFQQIDPFFVIDLSKDNPKILGELKIPGFSNYLHPYDENHVIGIGRDTTNPEHGGVRQLGIKIALFDVADVSNPKVVDDVIIGDARTQSDALHNHKAFFFDKSRKVLSIPINGYIKSLDGLHKEAFLSDNTKWYGFYVFDLDSTKGFNLRGTITHLENRSDGYQLNNGRTFYIDDTLYTASHLYLKMNLFNSLEEINSIKLNQQFYSAVDGKIKQNPIRHEMDSKDQ